MSKRPPTKHDPSGARLLEVDVEPLSEQRWSKIEHGVFARLESGAEAPWSDAARSSARVRAVRWLPRAASAVSLVLALSAFALFFLRGTNSTLSRVSTGASGSRLSLPGIVLDVSPESALVVSGDASESQLVVLDRGQVTCDVAHRRPGVPLIVQAGEVQVEVVGTHFSVTRTGDTARVVVQEGTVKVSGRGLSTLVHAGESWPPVAAPSAEPTTLPGPTESPPSSPPPLVADEPSAPRVPKAPPHPRAAGAKSSPSAASAAPDLEAPADLQSQFEAAARLEAKSPAQAIQLYRGLENGSSSWAKNALFAHGRLEAARGNRAEARRILQQYLSNSPQGPNAADARLLLGRLE